MADELTFITIIIIRRYLWCVSGNVVVLYLVV